MAELSWFWPSTTTGDASGVAPYAASRFRTLFGSLMSGQNNVAGIVAGGLEVGYVDYLTNSYRFRIGKGAAIINGCFYVNDEEYLLTLNTPALGTFYYTVVLRYASNKIRIAVRGPDTTTYPTIVQNASIWELPIARLSTSYAGYGISKTTVRVLSNGIGDVPLIRRVGNTADFDDPGTTVYVAPSDNALQMGVIKWTGNATYGTQAVTFPVAFDQKPLVFITPQPDWYEFISECVTTIVAGPEKTGFTIGWTGRMTRTELHIAWMAIGQKIYK